MALAPINAFLEIERERVCVCAGTGGCHWRGLEAYEMHSDHVVMQSA